MFMHNYQLFSAMFTIRVAGCLKFRTTSQRELIQRKDILYFCLLPPCPVIKRNKLYIQIRLKCFSCHLKFHSQTENSQYKHLRPIPRLDVETNTLKGHYLPKS